MSTRSVSTIDVFVDVLTSTPPDGTPTQGAVPRCGSDVSKSAGTSLLRKNRLPCTPLSATRCNRKTPLSKSNRDETALKKASLSKVLLFSPPAAVSLMKPVSAALSPSSSRLITIPSDSVFVENTVHEAGSNVGQEEVTLSSRLSPIDADSVEAEMETQPFGRVPWIEFGDVRCGSEAEQFLKITNRGSIGKRDAVLELQTVCLFLLSFFQKKKKKKSHHQEDISSYSSSFLISFLNIFPPSVSVLRCEILMKKSSKNRMNSLLRFPLFSYIWFSSSSFSLTFPSLCRMSLYTQESARGWIAYRLRRRISDSL